MFFKTNKVVFICVFSLTVLLTVCHAKKEQQQQQRNQKEIWEQDLTDTFKIEGSDQGIQKVNLKCGSNSMHIMLETEKPFTGVMYTRGSFYEQAAPCFVKPTTNGAKSLEMSFNLDQCQTQNDGELYSNIVVIQNDRELVTPGDSAFSLECDFRQPRAVDVEANMQARERQFYTPQTFPTSPSSVHSEESEKSTLHSFETSETGSSNHSEESESSPLHPFETSETDTVTHKDRVSKNIAPSTIISKDQQDRIEYDYNKFMHSGTMDDTITHKDRVPKNIAPSTIKSNDQHDRIEYNNDNFIHSATVEDIMKKEEL